MAESTWTNPEAALLQPRTSRLKYVIGGLLILAALAFLVINAAQGNTQLFITVEEFYSRQSELAGRDLKVAGIVGPTRQAVAENPLHLRKAGEAEMLCEPDHGGGLDAAGGGELRSWREEEFRTLYTWFYSYTVQRRFGFRKSDFRK